MLTLLQEMIRNDVYCVHETGKVTAVVDPLFSKETIKKWLEEGSEEMIKVFLETGYEQRAVYLKHKQRRLASDQRSHESKIKCLAYFKNAIKLHLLDGQTICTETIKVQLIELLNKAKTQYQEHVSQELDKGVFYHGHWIKKGDALCPQYVKSTADQMAMVLDPILPQENGSLADLKKQIGRLKDELKVHMKQIEVAQKQCDEQLQEYQKKYNEIMKARVARANEVLKKEKWKMYESFFNALISGKGFVNIPCNMVLTEAKDTLLHIALSREIPVNTTVKLLLERGADPLWANTKRNTPLHVSAQAYAASKCKSTTENAKCFSLLVSEISQPSAMFYFQYPALDNLVLLKEIEPLYQQARDKLQANVKLLYGLEDMRLNRVSKGVLPVEVNIVERVDKFVMMFLGLFKALENADVNYLFRVIDEASLQTSRNSEGSFSKGEKLHQDSRLISDMIALKNGYLSDREKSVVKPRTLSNALIFANQEVGYAMHQQEQTVLNNAIVQYQASAEKKLRETHARYQLQLKEKESECERLNTHFKEQIDELKKEHDQTVDKLTAEVSSKSSEIVHLKQSLSQAQKNENEAIEVAKKFATKSKMNEARVNALLEIMKGSSDTAEVDSDPSGNDDLAAQQSKPKGSLSHRP